MGRATQLHHYSYDPEVVGRCYKGEHELLTKLAWYERKTISSYFIRCLEAWIALHKYRATELEE
jgi:hypothetical protein